ncbi:MAG: serine hydrolase [Marinoscillum sp.]
MRSLKIFLSIVTIVAFQLQNAFAQNSTESDLESEILKIMNDHHVPGAGVALISKDRIVWMGTLGQADVMNNMPVTKNTLFTIGSISKTFLSAAAMVAQEKGMLDINDPIDKLVPSLEYSNLWHNTDPVRLIHLLEHTSGFDEAHFNLFPQADSATPFNEVMNRSQKSLETRWEPGKYFEYNTLGYVIAAHIIEENVSTSFEEFVSENLLLPLEMDGATYHPTDSITPSFSKGYTRNEMTEVSFPSMPQWPAGALTTTIEDLSNFVNTLLNNGQFKDKQILSPASVTRMETPETSLQAQAGVTYGYGKGVWGKIEKGHLFYGHSGRYGGFLSEYGYSRDLDLGYVILLNSSDGGRAIKAIKSVLLNSIDKRENEQVNQASKIMTTQLSEITGCYQPITSVPQLGEMGYFVYRLIDMPIIEEENGQLYQSSMLGDKQMLLHVKDLLFRNSSDPMATSAFVKAQNENWQWLTNEGSYSQIPMWWGYVQFYLALICILLIVIGFISLLFWIPVRLIRKKREGLQLQVFLFLALCSLVGMIASIGLFYDPEKLHSAGAILFLIFGWSFFALSLLAVIRMAIMMYKKAEVNGWIKYHALLISLACFLCASYLLYWNIIGLTLWDY